MSYDPPHIRKMDQKVGHLISTAVNEAIAATYEAGYVTGYADALAGNPHSFKMGKVSKSVAEPAKPETPAVFDRAWTMVIDGVYDVRGRGRVIVGKPSGSVRVGDEFLIDDVRVIITSIEMRGFEGHVAKEVGLVLRGEPDVQQGMTIRRASAIEVTMANGNR